VSSESWPSTVISHWYQLFEDFQTSPMDFYKSVEAAIRKRQVPDAEISRVDWREGGAFSAAREYLRIGRGRLIFDICAAPFGNSFFISWWLATTQSSLGTVALLSLMIGFGFFMGVSMIFFGFFKGLVLVVVGTPILFWLFVKLMSHAKEGWDDALVAMPIFGSLYERVFRPETYYRMDTTLMFQEAVRRSVLEVIDGLTSAKGIRVLTELERKPIMRELAGR
jgi:hypothetical protein